MKVLKVLDSELVSQFGRCQVKDCLPKFREIAVNQQGFVLLKLVKRVREQILKGLSNHEVAHLIHYLDPDDATDVLQFLSERRRRLILERVGREIKKKVEFLLRFNPHTAAGLMDLNYIEVEVGSTFGEVAKMIRKHEQRIGKYPVVLIVAAGYLLGELPSHQLVLHSPKEFVDKFVRRISTMRYDHDEKQVLQAFENHAHKKIVVLDADESIIGVIYSDDVLRLINQHAARHLADFAGLREEEEVCDSAFSKVRYRYKWLIINLGTAFLAASVVSLFEETIQAFVLLAVYLPIVAGMGGNAGTQTLAVVVRGLTLHQVNFASAKKVVVNEMVAGAVNGLINGVIVAIVASLWNKNPLFGLVVGVAMVGNLVIAGLFGTMIPLLMQRLGKDPASSATIFITTATDVFGFFFFLGLASMVL